MAMNYEELDRTTRQHMLAEFEAEQAGANPYRGRRLSQAGSAMFPDLMRSAINSGDETSLTTALNDPSLWKPYEEYIANDVMRTRRINVPQNAHTLALTEFSTWYVRGLAGRLVQEGVQNCQIYRGEQPKWEPGDCIQHEGMVVSVHLIYQGHRARYWPEPGDAKALSIPFAPGCHHLIRRI